MICVKTQRLRSSFRGFRGIGAWLCAGLLAFAAAGHVPAAAPEPRIWDVHAARFVSEPELVGALARARYRLLGEVHDNPAHHVIRARLIAAIAGKGLRPAVVFEQFDLEHDAALSAAQAAGANAEQLADAGRLDRRAWAWPLHKPVIEAALATHLPIRAGNLARALLGGDLQTALERDAGAIWYSRLHAASWTEQQTAELHGDIVQSHCGKLPEAIVPRLVAAQRMRDATMAQALVDAATESGAILIAGNGHVRSDLGVPVYLHAASLSDRAAQSVSLGLVETSAEEEHATDFIERVVMRHPGFDYLWLTAPVTRDDPCERLK